MTSEADNKANPVLRAQELMRTELPKRFYKQASLEPREGGRVILLDGRPVKTPSRNILHLPTDTAAELVRSEWDRQEKVIDPAKMPVTRLANTVIDGVTQNHEAVFEEIIAYSDNDMLFYRAESPKELVERQHELWDPVLDWAGKDLGARFVLVEGIMPTKQPAESIAAVRCELERHRDPFALGSLHVITTVTGSALLGLALLRGRLDLDEAWQLANLEEDWTIEHWGRDEESERRRAKHYEDLKAAHDLAKALQA